VRQQQLRYSGELISNSILPMDYQVSRDVGVKILVMCYNTEKKIRFCPEIMFAKTLEFHYIVGIKTSN
jgi:hypothetical protein